MKNLEIAKLLNNIADMLELQEVEFKPQAYRKAALAIESLTEDIHDICKRGDLEEIPGVGKHIAEKIEEFLKAGKLKYYEKLKKEIKVDLEQLNAIPGLGPKRIKVLYHKLGVKNIPDLVKAIRQGKLQQLYGFGEETAKNLLQGIEFLKSSPRRFLYAQVQPMVAQFLQTFQQYDFVDKAEVAGSFRRGKETVGDLDFLVISSRPEKVMDAFVSLPDVKEVISKGTTRSSIRLSNGLQIDLRVLRRKEWGSALLYFIGGKDHNVALRKLALDQEYTLSEYGLFTVQGKKWIAGRTEDDIYQKLGLKYIEPELRENTGEIEAAHQNKLPKLISLPDVRGLFHNHSVWSDGNNSLLEMAQRAEQLGFRFISCNDHYGHIGITNPLTEKRLQKYLQEIEKVRKKVGIRIFSGVEIDILKDGTLPLSVQRLRELDVVIASVHMALKMGEREMTRRVTDALQNYPVNILGHPTDRIINVRQPISLHLDTVFEVARQRNIFLEINASPQRMDLTGEQVKAGLQAGCSFALGTDAHSIHGFYPQLGVLMARRGWLEKKDVLNCWSLPKIEKALEK